ncbi:MAG: nucleotidyltransferase domain-containing protein [Candidatus Bathyarchaeales archaeon]
MVGPTHPFDRVLAYVKYVPANTGKWRDERVGYERVMRDYTIPSLLETFHLLRTKYPQYVFHSDVFGIDMTAVPLGLVKQHFRPEHKLDELLKTAKRDLLQEKLVKLVNFLSEESGIPTSNFGVTGSILLGIHNPKFSDIDLAIYGQRNSQKLKETINKIVTNPDSPIKRFDGALLEDWCRKKSRRYPLTLEDARRIIERKWNLGVFEGTLFSVHPAKVESEMTERYGDKTYRPEDAVTIKATVIDNGESMFLPCVYKVGDVKIIGGNQTGTEVEEIVSYESLYDSVAETGEKILVKGKLEHVIDHRSGKEYYRILVGSPEGKGEEYIKFAK